MPETPAVPTIIVTGFLGAGKTTLIRRLLETADRRTAVLVNEFGEVGFDGDLIARVAPDVIELKNGCICCRVGDDLVPAIERLIERDPAPEALIVETSGLALPQPVVEAFGFATLWARTRIAGVVTVADATLLHEGAFDAVLEGLRAPPSLAPRRPSALHGGADGSDDPIGEVFEDQLRAADLVILAKLDRLGEDERAHLRARLDARLPATLAVAEARHGALAPGTLDALIGSPPKPWRHGLEDGTHDHDDFESVAVEMPPVAGRELLERRVLAAVARFGLLRVKGSVDVGTPARRFTVQATARSVTTTPEPSTAPARLVVIGVTGLDREAITAILRGHAE